MIDKKQIIESKLLFILPKVISIIVFIFFAYIDGALISGCDFGKLGLNIPIWKEIIDTALFAFTVVFLMSILTPNQKICLMSNTTGNCLILDKALYFNKYRVDKVIPLGDIKNVEITEVKHSSRQGENILYTLNIKNINGKLIFSKAYVQKEQMVAESAAEQVRAVLSGHADSFLSLDNDYDGLDGTFILFIIIQLLVNWNYIKQIFF